MEQSLKNGENIMRLTPKQNEVIEKYKSLESKYGKGNVFLRYINDFWKVRFIIHKIDEKKYSLISDYKINGKVIILLDKNNLLVGYDNKHEKADPNSWRSQPQDWFFVGSRIRTECK